MVSWFSMNWSLAVRAKENALWRGDLAGGHKTLAFEIKSSRGGGVRTHDLLVPNQARYQLRYAPSVPKCTRFATSVRISR